MDFAIRCINSYGRERYRVINIGNRFADSDIGKTGHGFARTATSKRYTSIPGYTTWPAEDPQLGHPDASRGHPPVQVGDQTDLLLGRSLGDFDVATSARPEEILRVFGARFSVPTGLQHGTVTVLAGEPARQVEVTTFRGEGAYLDGRHPSVVTFGATLAEDLSRRDFTMNAIAFDPRARTIIDLHQGQHLDGCATLRGGFRHTVDHARRFVLHENISSGAFDGADAGGAVAAHACQDNCRRAAVFQPLYPVQRMRQRTCRWNDRVFQ